MVSKIGINMAGKICNTVFIKDGRIVQLDDVISQNNQPPEPGPVPPGPVPPGPVPPGPTPPGPTPPEPKVDVEISIDGSMVSIIATGDVSYIAGYDVNVYSDGTKVMTYKVEGAVEDVDLDALCSDLPDGAFVITVQAYSDDGTVFPESNGVDWVHDTESRTILGTMVNGVFSPLAAGNSILTF